MNLTADCRYQFFDTGWHILPAIDLWFNRRTGCYLRWISFELTFKWIRFEFWASLDVDF